VLIILTSQHLTTPVFGKDVVYDIPNDKFMEQKKFVKVGLTTENLRAYVGMIEDEVEHFMDNDAAFSTWQQTPNEWGTIEVDTTMSQITILTAARTLQGAEVRNGMDKSFAQLYTDLDGGFTPLHWMLPGLPLPSYRRRDAAQAKMSQFYRDVMQKRKDGQSEETHDMIAALMDQKYRDGQALKEHEIAHIMIALLMAGQHTSAATSSWSILHLANEPDIAYVFTTLYLGHAN
jgi:sterol 14-demethylase